MTLFYVQGDTEYVRIRRRGRFSVESDCAASPAHRKAAVKAAMARFVLTMNKQGMQYVDDGNVTIERLPEHLEFSEDVTPDLGNLAQPDYRDVEACALFERAEKAKLARSVEPGIDLVDFRIIATFRKALAPRFRPILAQR